MAPVSVILAYDGDEASVSWQNSGDGWSLGARRVGEYVDVGVGFHASGKSAEALEQVYRAVRATHFRVAYHLDVAEQADERTVPLFAARMAHLRVNREIATLTVLCRLLADKPGLRDRLSDVVRVNQLLADIRRGSRLPVGEKLHVRRGAVEIRTAMHALGLVHRYDGRPIPGDELARNREEAVDAVLRHIGSNRYANGVQVSPQQVAAQLEREYFSVTPWPFHALAP